MLFYEVHIKFQIIDVLSSTDWNKPGIKQKIVFW